MSIHARISGAKYLRILYYIFKFLESINRKVYLYSLLLSFISLVFVFYTLPNNTNEIGDYIQLSRNLIIAIGAGFFGLLGFLIGGLAIILSLHQPKTSEDFIFSAFYIKEYKIAVTIILTNIIISVFVYLITCIPEPFNPIVLFIFSFIVFFGFFIGLIQTGWLFNIGLKPYQEGLDLQKNIKFLENFNNSRDLKE
ncbi:hypothetical protein [Rossellomorea sp. LjRoot5]|uniref:hypothetical protein n=1 Tax=Rossellomorea sp. LjRoot5 TaxID=3342331 RepID=UPI003ECF603E